ncbi:MAG: RNA methyltransferase [Bacilli bacterium]|nr:RNA methyltransferase [Bacilli bacterium]
MKVITSVTNPLIKELALLKNKKNRIEKQMFIVEGYHLVEEAYKNNCLVQVLTTDENLNYSNIDIIKTTDIVIKKLSSTIEPQGIIGIVKMPKFEMKDYHKYLVLDDVADPGNLGTIMRSSLALGIDALIVSPDTVDEYNDKVLRATQGAIFRLPIFRCDLEKTLLELKKKDIPVLVTSLRDASDVTTLARMEKFAIVFGNEARGVNDKYLKLADKVVKITMHNDVESLNVAMSAGIIAYYLINK